MDREVTGISQEAVSRLQEYDWPGNVRELDNIIQRHVALCNGSEIDSVQLRDQSASSTPGVETHLQEFGIPDQGMDLEDRLGEIEMGYLREALRATGGNMTEAARLLGMSYRSMRYRVQKLRTHDTEPVL